MSDSPKSKYMADDVKPEQLHSDSSRGVLYDNHMPPIQNIFCTSVHSYRGGYPTSDDKLYKSSCPALDLMYTKVLDSIAPRLL